MMVCLYTDSRPCPRPTRDTDGPPSNNRLEEINCVRESAETQGREMYVWSHITTSLGSRCTWVALQV